MQTVSDIWQSQLQHWQQQSILSTDIYQRLQSDVQPFLQQLTEHAEGTAILQVGLQAAQHGLDLQLDYPNLVSVIIYPWLVRELTLTRQTDPVLNKKKSKPGTSNTSHQQRDMEMMPLLQPPPQSWPPLVPACCIPVLNTLDRLQQYQHCFWHNSSLHTQARYIKSFQQLILNSCKDPQFLLAKLCLQLADLQARKQHDNKARIDASIFNLNIYAPLAGRLGVSRLKWQLEDLALRFTQPDIYRKIAQGLQLRRKQRDIYLQQLQAEVTMLLQQSGLQHFKVQARAKNITSIMRKLDLKQLTMQQVYDNFALRILVDSVHDCYSALGAIHSHWHNLASEFTDYIARPKENGYQSVHTVISDTAQRSIEVQIRTHMMHQHAEFGVAAHWLYKQEQTHALTNPSKKNTLNKQNNRPTKSKGPQSTTDDRTDITPTHSTTTYSQQLLQHNNYIQVFTPQADIINLPQGATALDFAYAIHAEVGHRCKGALINGQLTHLKHPLQLADRVEILTQRQAHPSRDWLHPYAGYIVTRKARHHLKHWFRQQQTQQHLLHGQQVWDKQIAPSHFPKLIIQAAIHSFQRKDRQALLVALGSGEISAHTLIQRLQQLNTGSHTSAKKSAPTTDLSDASQHSSVSHAPPRSPTHKTLHKAQTLLDPQGMLLQTANCCRPIPGDNISGYITQGRGLSLHRDNCRNLPMLRLQYPERHMACEWPKQPSQRLYACELLIHAMQQRNVLQAISNLIHDAQWPLQSMHSHALRQSNQLQIRVALRIDHLNSLTLLMQQLRQISGVTQVQRPH